MEDAGTPGDFSHLNISNDMPVQGGMDWRGLPQLPQQEHSLLVGPPRSGKTSILFQYAHSVVEATLEAEVLFICNKEKMESACPLMSLGLDTSSEALERIHMSYVSNGGELRMFCSSLQILNLAPRLLIVDDFTSFFRDGSHSEFRDRAKEPAMIRTLALLFDAAKHINNKLKDQKGTCRLLVSDLYGSPDTPRIPFFFKKWLPRVLRVEGCENGMYQVNLDQRRL